MICAHSEDDPPMAEGLSEEVYEVQRILKKTVDDNGIFYLVRHLQIFWARTFIDLSYTFVLQKADIAWNLNKNILKKKHNFLGSLEGIRPRRGLMGTRREFGLCLCCNQDFRGQGSWKVRSLNFWSYFVGKHYCKVHLSLVYKNSDNLKTECKWSLQEILKLHFDCFFKHFHQICLSKKYHIFRASKKKGAKAAATKESSSRSSKRSSMSTPKEKDRKKDEGRRDSTSRSSTRPARKSVGTKSREICSRYSASGEGGREMDQSLYFIVAYLIVFEKDFCGGESSVYPRMAQAKNRLESRDTEHNG